MPKIIKKNVILCPFCGHKSQYSDADLQRGFTRNGANIFKPFCKNCHCQMQIERVGKKLTVTKLKEHVKRAPAKVKPETDIRHFVMPEVPDVIRGFRGNLLTGAGLKFLSY